MQEKRIKLNSVADIKMFVRAAENCPFEIDARLQDQVGQSEIIPPANGNEKIFGGVD